MGINRNKLSQRLIKHLIKLCIPYPQSNEYNASKVVLLAYNNQKNICKLLDGGNKRVIKIFSYFVYIISRKYSEAGIHSKSKEAIFFNHKSNMIIRDKIFLLEKSYKVGRNSKRWDLTVFGRTLLEKIHIWDSSKIKGLKTKLSKREEAVGRMLDLTTPEEPVSNILINSDDVWENSETHDLVLSKMVSNTNTRFIDCSPTNKNSSRIGRSYNFFTMVNHDVRSSFGYVGYDIDCAMQSICLNLCKDSLKYPTILFYVNNKHKVREELCKIYNNSDIKTILLSIQNGKSLSQIKKTLEVNVLVDDYIELLVIETQLLVDEILKSQDNNRYKLALLQSKYSKSYKEQGVYNKYSILFFIWTWYERQIRSVMGKYLGDTIPCHDCVYSKLDIDPDILENVIYEELGFKVRITKERSE